MICISEYTPLSKYVESHEDSFKEVVSDIFKPKGIVRIEEILKRHEKQVDDKGGELQ